MTKQKDGRNLTLSLTSVISTEKRRKVIVSERTSFWEIACSFTCEWADAFQAGLSLIGCFDGDRYKFAVVTLTVEHFIGRYFASLFVDGEFSAFLIRLLNYRVFDLWIKFHFRELFHVFNKRMKEIKKKFLWKCQL